MNAKRVCKECGIEKDYRRRRDIKLAERRKYIDEDGKLWNGKICGKCRGQRDSKHTKYAKKLIEDLKLSALYASMKTKTRYLDCLHVSVNSSITDARVELLIKFKDAVNNDYSQYHSKMKEAGLL